MTFYDFSQRRVLKSFRFGRRVIILGGETRFLTIRDAPDEWNAYCFGERISANLWKRQGKGWFVTTIPSQWFKQRSRLLSRITYQPLLVGISQFLIIVCVCFLVVVEEEEDGLTSSSAAGGVLLDVNWADAMTTFYFNMKYNLHLTSTNFACILEAQ